MRINFLSLTRRVKHLFSYDQMPLTNPITWFVRCFIKDLSRVQEFDLNTLIFEYLAVYQGVSYMVAVVLIGGTTGGTKHKTITRDFPRVGSL